MGSELKNKILIIDDQEIIHNDFKKILSEKRTNEAQSIVNSFLKKEKSQGQFIHKDFDIDCVLQGKDGFEKIKLALKSQSPYKVAFVDMRMPPGWDGLETITHIFKEDRDIQCVICTAYSDYTWDDIAKTIGPTDRLLILKKPFDAVEVIQLAYTLVQKWDLQKEHRLRLENMSNLVAEKSEQVETVEKQLIRSSKLASIGTLAAAVAHEINNPLTIIQGNMDILKMLVNKYKLEDKQLELIFSRQNNAISRINNIVSGLRSFARVDSESSEVMDIHELIHDSIDLIESIYHKDGILFQTKLDASKSRIIANLGRMQQVFMNLFSNARDAMIDSPKKIIQVNSKVVDGKIVLEIRDYGHGITKENLSKIFDSFFTTKEVGKGTGLGLSITYKIVKAFGGDISVESSLGEGTSFFISIPYTDQEIKKMQVVQTLKHEKKSGQVLVVDDEEPIRDILKMFLKEVGYDVETARSAQEAIDLMMDRDFDYVITDLMMPEMNGDDLIKIIKNKKGEKSPKFILITGCLWVDDQKKIEQYASLADAVIKKPFKQKQIIEAIQNIQVR